MHNRQALLVKIVFVQLLVQDGFIAHQDHLIAKVLFYSLDRALDLRKRRFVASKGVNGYAHVTPWRLLSACRRRCRICHTRDAGGKARRTWRKCSLPVA